MFKKWYNRTLRDASVRSTIKDAIRLYEDGCSEQAIQLLEYAIKMIRSKSERESYAN